MLSSCGSHPAGKSQRRIVGTLFTRFWCVALYYSNVVVVRLVGTCNIVTRDCWDTTREASQPNLKGRGETVRRTHGHGQRTADRRKSGK
jgi:hypothetical protein